MKQAIIIYGYGNPGRQDDGLGNAFIEDLQQWSEDNNISGIDFDSNYQLNIEDAEMIAERQIAVFVDASIEDIDDYCLTVVNPASAQIEFTMHAVSPAFVLNLCKDIYKNIPETYLLHIKGYEYDFIEEISFQARENLNKALMFMKEILVSAHTDQIAEKLRNSVSIYQC